MREESVRKNVITPAHCKWKKNKPLTKKCSLLIKAVNCCELVAALANTLHFQRAKNVQKHQLKCVFGRNGRSLMVTGTFLLNSSAVTRREGAVSEGHAAGTSWTLHPARACLLCPC